ncbi:MAG: hypothetical protein ACR2OX_00840, partial [Methyloligellaceae bacterium]
MTSGPPKTLNPPYGVCSAYMELSRIMHMKSVFIKTLGNEHLQTRRRRRRRRFSKGRNALLMGCDTDSTTYATGNVPYHKTAAIICQNLNFYRYRCAAFCPNGEISY